MDKNGMMWGFLVGAIWGVIYWTAQWPRADKIVAGIDKGMYFVSGTKLTPIFGGTVILAVLFGVICMVIGGVMGTGRRAN